MSNLDEEDGRKLKEIIIVQTHRVMKRMQVDSAAQIQ